MSYNPFSQPKFEKVRTKKEKPYTFFCNLYPADIQSVNRIMEKSGVHTKTEFFRHVLKIAADYYGEKQ